MKCQRWGVGETCWGPLLWLGVRELRQGLSQSVSVPLPAWAFLFFLCVFEKEETLECAAGPLYSHAADSWCPEGQRDLSRPPGELGFIVAEEGGLGLLLGKPHHKCITSQVEWGLPAPWRWCTDMPQAPARG